MIYHGVCYYPEHWTVEQAKHHIPLMQQAGINVVRMGEFAWCKFEPEQGRYRFDWLDPVIEALAKAGIATVLGTPTAIPPQWVITRHPGILQKDEKGHVRGPGSRCHACKNAPQYLILAETITRELARHYAKMPGVIGWQTDNEFGCHETTRCYCEHCEKAFREWLLGKYKTTDAVNEAWGTSFWGFDFRSWNEIPLPRYMPAGSNPSHWLDFVRFSSGTQIKFHSMQSEILKAQCPTHFVTHNYMGTFPEIDYHKLSRLVDFPAWDNYPDPYGDPYKPAYAHEITRPPKGTFWVMEQRSGSTGDANAGIWGEQPEPGEIRRWTWQAIANGASGVLYYRWRVCLSGAEQYWHGILDHDGVPRRRYTEIRSVSEELIRVSEELEGTHVKALVGMFRDFETLWSIDRQPGASGFRYDDHCFDLYRAVKRVGHNCDLISFQDEIDRYRVVIAPCLALVDEALVRKLTAYVEAGGTLMLTPQTGLRTFSNIISDRTRPGLLAGLAGLTIEETRPYHHGQTDEVEFIQGTLKGQTCSVGKWVEWLQCTSATPIAEFRSETGQGKTAVACHAVGKGKVYYLGVYLPAEPLKTFMEEMLPDFPIRDIPDGVEVTMRYNGQKRFVFILNNTRERQSLTLPAAFPELLSGQTVGPKIALARNGVLILRA